MRKVLELAVFAVLLICYTSCTQSQKQTNEAALTTATATPTPATPTPTPTGPMTAAVKGSDFEWADDVSGTPVTTIKVGGTVTWTITEGTHRLAKVASTPANGCKTLEDPFDSGDLTEGKSESRTFTTIGTFGYKCGIHGGTPKCNTPPGSGMSGVIKVVP